MSKYIEREALKAEFMKHYACEYPAALVMAIIDNVSTADVVEVRHGKWIRHEKDGAIFADYECSICSAYPTGGIRSYYCPNCGSRMDLE